MKWRNSKERELLANGGSREQTLPNKNNPNPDLSDVKDVAFSTGGEIPRGSCDGEDIDEMEDDDAASAELNFSSSEVVDSFTTERTNGDRTRTNHQEPLESLIAASQLSLSQVSGHTDSASGRLHSPNSPKLLIKDLAALGAHSDSYDSARATISFASRYQQQRGEMGGDHGQEHDYSDEDINVTDDMTASNNEDSDVD